MPQGPIPTQLFGQVQLPALASKPAQMGKQLDLLVGQSLPANYEATYAGQSMFGANPYASAVTTSAALATIYVGLCLSNPAANTNNLVLLGVSVNLVVAPAALTAFGLILGYSAAGVVTHTTALTPLNSFLNGAAPTAKLDSACTIVGTPAWGPYLGSVTPTTTGVTASSKDFAGSIIIPPGGYVAIGTTIAGPASGFIGSMQWLEIPV